LAKDPINPKENELVDTQEHKNRKGLMPHCENTHAQLYAMRDEAHH